MCRATELFIDYATTVMTHFSIPAANSKQLLLCLSFPMYQRHRETWADLLDEFQIHLQVLQRSPEGERRRGAGGDLQHRHHAQQLAQKQTPGSVESHRYYYGRNAGFWGDREVGRSESNVEVHKWYIFFSFIVSSSVTSHMIFLFTVLPECHFSPPALPGFALTQSPCW